MGTKRDSIDKLLKKENEFCFITLYLTEDPANNDVSLIEYVDKDQKSRYKEIFKKHNDTSPKKKSFLGFDLSSLKKKERAGEKRSPFDYETLKGFVKSFRERYSLEDLKLSFIFKDMTEEEYNLCLLDESRGTFYPSGDCKFFNTTEELLN